MNECGASAGFADKTPEGGKSALTPVMVAVLRNAHAGLPGGVGFHGEAERDAADWAVWALQKRGYLEASVVTPAGLAALQAEGSVEDGTAPSADCERDVAEVPSPSDEQSFQGAVGRWMLACFGVATSSDLRERGDRLLEEVLELLQSHGYDPRRVATLTRYVYGRPPGKPDQEVGGVMLTLAAYCRAAKINMMVAGHVELQRVWRMIDVIRAKQRSKRGLHTPLPTAEPKGAEAPSPVPAEAATAAGVDEIPDWLLPTEDEAAFAKLKARAGGDPDIRWAVARLQLLENRDADRYATAYGMAQDIGK